MVALPPWFGSVSSTKATGVPPGSARSLASRSRKPVPFGATVKASLLPTIGPEAGTTLTVTSARQNP